MISGSLLEESRTGFPATRWRERRARTESMLATPFIVPDPPVHNPGRLVPTAPRILDLPGAVLVGRLPMLPTHPALSGPGIEGPGIEGLPTTRCKTAPFGRQEP